MHITIGKRNKEEIIQELSNLPISKLIAMIRLYNSNVPCEICGNPVGPGHIKYCANCLNLRIKNNIKKASKKIYWKRERRKRITEAYSPLIDKLPVKFDREKLIDSILEVIKFRTSRRRGREQVLATAIMFLGGYPERQVAKWFGMRKIPLWRKVKKSIQ